MQIRGLVVGDRAVSPVIGVILMVAITVILAAVIGVFVLGIGGQQETVPQATFDVEKVKEGSVGNPDELEVTHSGGASIDAENLYLSFDSSQIQESASPSTPGPADRLSWSELDPSVDGVSAGDSVVIEPENGKPETEDKVLRFVWERGDQSSIIYTWRGPRAG